jgi:prophage antirepressor-like protein
MECIQILNQSKILDKQFTMYGTKEEPLFVAKDVAAWIGHSNPTEMIRNIDEDEKLNSTILSAGQNREVSLLTENGLYEVLMQSRKEKAKQFKKEVKAILKQIRLTGGYIPIKQEEDDITILSKAAVILQRTLDLKEAQIKELQPKAEMFDMFIQSSGCISLNSASKSLNVGRNKFMRFLREHKILFKEGNDNIPYQRFCKNGCFRINCMKGNDGVIHTVTRVNPKGMKFLSSLLKRYELSANLEVAK